MLLVGCQVLPESANGILLVGPSGTSRSAALVQQQLFFVVWFGRTGGFYLTWLFVRIFSILGGSLGSLSLFSVRLFGLPPGCLCLIRVAGQSLRKFKGFGGYDDRLQFMARDDALNLGEALRDEDVSRAWDVWSSAAEDSGEDPETDVAFAEALQLDAVAMVAWQRFNGKGKGKSKGKGKVKGKGKGKNKGNNLSLEERKKRVGELKSRTNCQACGARGHWAGDDICPNNSKNESTLQ